MSDGPDPAARRRLVLELGLRLRACVLPELGAFAGRAHAGGGAGGDITFAVDAVAETALEEFLAERAPELAYYSEDRGLVASGTPTEVLVVDPIDGTRPAMAGLESACVAVAVAPLGDGEPTMGDVSAASVVEIKSGAWFLAARDQGVEMSSGTPRLSPNQDPTRMFWSYGFRGRPARATVEVLGDLIDGSSVGAAPSSWAVRRSR
jgi:myo-inositol-1(or 4)-monophosphatase